MNQFKVMGLAAVSGLAALCVAAPASAQVEPYLGQVSLFATNWCPNNWLPANGAVVPISTNSALFSLLGTTYGGNGQTTFGLPNLQDRAPISWSGTNPLGQASGSTSFTLSVAQMPQHTHLVMGTTAATTTNSPAGGSLGTFPAGQTIYAPNTATPNVPMHAGIIGLAGGNQPIPTQSPVLAMNWCIAVAGIFPTRP